MARLSGLMDQAQGKTTEFTKEWMEAAIAQNHAATNARIGAIWEGNLTDEIIKQNNALGYNIRANRQLQQGNIRTGASLDKLIAANKKLNDELYRRKQAEEDAIRAGDARALADARAMGGSSALNNRPNGAGGLANRGAGGGGGGAAGNMGAGGKFTLIIEGKPFSAIVDKKLKDDVFIPTAKAKSGGKKK